MSWNYRVMAHEDGDDVYLKIHEVYYDSAGNPTSYTHYPCRLTSETVKGLIWNIEQLKLAVDLPILYYGSKFPEEYKP